MPRSPDYSDSTDEAERPLRPSPGETITPVLKPNEARGGVTHHNVRLILAVSLFLVIAAMIVAYFGFFPTPEPMEALPAPPA
jgi:hypothetical protein